MPTRDIVCLNCGFTGLLDIHCDNDITLKHRLFSHLGHDPYSGALHYRCPGCDVILLVDPTAALGEEYLEGLPGMVTVPPGQKGGYWSGYHDLFRWFNGEGNRA